MKHYWGYPSHTTAPKPRRADGYPSTRLVTRKFIKQQVSKPSIEMFMLKAVHGKELLMSTHHKSVHHVRPGMRACFYPVSRMYDCWNDVVMYR